MYMKKFERIVCQPKSNISNIKFGYNTKMEVYATMVSDIPELSEIENKRLKFKNNIAELKDMHT